MDPGTPLSCGCPPGADSEEVTHQGLHWHARAACFCCSLCRKPLRGQPLACRRGRLFCSDSCSRGQDASSTASSDSSDSAFASAPSPDSTPLSRAGPAGRSSAAGGCRQRGEGAGRILVGWWIGWDGSGSKSRLCPAAGGFTGNVTAWEVVINPQPTSHGGSWAWVGATPLCPKTALAVGRLWEGWLSFFLPHLAPLSLFQRRFRIRPRCTPRSGARRIWEQPRRSGAAMLPRSTRGHWDPQPATPRPLSPAQRGPTSLEPWATRFWGALTPEQPQAAQTHTSKRAHPRPGTAPGQRMARRRTTPGAPPAPHLRTRTRRRKVSFSGSPSPSPG